MTLIKAILIMALGIIFFQDIKDRMVYWFLFPVVGLCVGILFFLKTLPELFYTSILINLVFVSILLGTVFLYTKFKLKKHFSNAIGIGDVLFLFALIFACESVSFIILLTSALIFSLVLHICLSKKNKSVTVPLAGYMSLFFGITYLGFWFGIIDSLYNV
ncbi:general secretion pathway protein [Flavivirga eckloniae]|uniref:General secretion pathway protein n=1 Tax=Flavivirga eckloniae TaxID=1803846 RepID=A0A2K9PXR8_9FLAO|nr:general secretion pathway protein [Flavivirga eckloniae]